MNIIAETQYQDMFYIIYNISDGIFLCLLLTAIFPGCAKELILFLLFLAVRRDVLGCIDI